MRPAIFLTTRIPLFSHRWAILFVVLGWSSALHIDHVRSATFEYKCVVNQAFLQERQGQLALRTTFVGNVFHVSKETGKIGASSVGPFFAAPSSKQQILYAGGRGEPFTLVSTNRSGEGGINVEFLAVRDFEELPKKTFLAYGVGGMIFTGTCE